MTDDQLGKYLPIFGDRLACINYCKSAVKREAGMLCSFSTSTKNDLLEKLQNKLKLKRKASNNNATGDASPSLNFSCSQKKAKETRKIEIALTVETTKNDRTAGKAVKARQGGGTRIADVAKTSVRKDIIDSGISLFFPDGKSKLGKVNDFDLELLDFQHNVVDANQSVGDMYEKCKLRMLKFYLKLKSTRMSVLQYEQINSESMEIEKNTDSVILCDTIEYKKQSAPSMVKNEDNKQNISSTGNTKDKNQNVVTTAKNNEMTENCNAPLKSDDEKQRYQAGKAIKTVDLPTLSNAKFKGQALYQKITEVKRQDVIFHNQLGAGAFGTVYRGTWAGTDFAIKEISLKRVSETLKKQIMTEVLIHSQLRHPNITQLVAIVWEPTAICLLSELVTGTSLEDWIFTTGVQDQLPLTGRKVHVMKQLLQAICYMHCQQPPVVHGDVKPANVLLAWDSTVKLCDMGLSRIRNRQSALLSAHAGQIVGTPAYMAPEVYLEGKATSTCTDMWSVGITFLELLTRKESWLDTSDLRQLLESKVMPQSIDELVIKQKVFIQRMVNYDALSRASASVMLGDLCDELE